MMFFETEVEHYSCGMCGGPVITFWSEEGLEEGDYLLLGDVFFHKGECTFKYLEEFAKAYNDETSSE